VVKGPEPHGVVMGPEPEPHRVMKGPKPEPHRVMKGDGAGATWGGEGPEPDASVLTTRSILVSRPSRLLIFP